MKIYLIGSLKDPGFPEVASDLRAAGHDVFDDWRAGGKDGDVRWADYEMQHRGRGYIAAISAPFSACVREFDRQNICEQDCVIAVCKENSLPGRSSIAELAYAKLSLGRKAYVLLNGEPDEWDQMLPLVVDQFFYDVDTLLKVLT